jgi:hypothetical protein
MTQTLTTDIKTILDVSIATISGRNLATLNEVRDILLDVRNGLNSADQSALVEIVDTRMRTWPSSDIVATSEVVDFLLDIRAKLK